MLPSSNKRVLLLSGGLDSTALAVLMRPEHALTIDYGQVSAPGEIRAAAAIGERLGIPHSVLRCDCSAIGSGLLAGTDAADVAPVSEWWPFRNQLLLTLAGAWAISSDCKEIVIGSVKGDDAHVDGTERFYEGIASVIAMQEGALVISAPALSKSCVSLIREADIPAGLLGFTHSCHRGEWACGLCPGCIKRAETLDAVEG